ncbi:MAG: IS110 family transposase [Tissierellia bacterium]|nr:IS110 family transposase [Tissierellia bacterium]
MLYLGIDIGKNNHVASLIDEKGKIVFKAFSFSNTVDGGENLLSKLNNFIPSISDIEIGMEATGHYWLSIYSFLVEKGFVIHVVNPIQTDGWRKGTEIRKRKTDIIDSVLIAELIRYGDFLETSLADENTMSLRNLSRFRNYLIGSIGDLKRKTICVLDQVFPEYQSVFSDVFGQTSKEILLNFSSPGDFENISSDQLQKALSEITMKKFAANKINQLSSMAKRSFGVTFCLDSFALQLKLLIEQINFIENQVKDIEQQISNLLDKINSTITTIPGIGKVTAATILGEIGDISRFSTPSKLVAYAGIDASVSQSGEYHSTNNKMSKRGSPYLRKALFSAALVASNCDPVFKAYYQRKRAEGKHHLTAVGAVARKLCYTIHAILKNNCPYEVRLPNND